MGPLPSLSGTLPGEAFAATIYGEQHADTGRKDRGRDRWKLWYRTRDGHEIHRTARVYLTRRRAGVAGVTLGRQEPYAKPPLLVGSGGGARIRF